MTMVFKPRGRLPVEEQERLRRVILQDKNWKRKFNALAKIKDQNFIRLRATNSGYWFDRALATHFLLDTRLLQKIHTDPKEHSQVRDVAGRRYMHLLR